MDCLVVKEHESDYPDPITLEKGENVLVGREYEGKEDWDNWRYCYKLDESQEGWVPEQLIDVSGQSGVVKEDYTAKELTIEAGEKLKGIEELNGWVWCRDREGR